MFSLCVCLSPRLSVHYETSSIASLPSQFGVSLLFHQAVVEQYSKAHNLGLTPKQAAISRKQKNRDARKAKKAEDVKDKLEARGGTVRIGVRRSGAGAAAGTGNGVVGGGNRKRASGGAAAGAIGSQSFSFGSNENGKGRRGSIAGTSSTMNDSTSQQQQKKNQAVKISPAVSSSSLVCNTKGVQLFVPIIAESIQIDSIREGCWTSCNDAVTTGRACTRRTMMDGYGFHDAQLGWIIRFRTTVDSNSTEIDRNKLQCFVPATLLVPELALSFASGSGFASIDGAKLQSESESQAAREREGADEAELDEWTASRVAAGGQVMNLLAIQREMEEARVKQMQGRDAEEEDMGF